MDQSLDLILDIGTGLGILFAIYGAILYFFRIRLYCSISRLNLDKKARLYASYKKTIRLLYIFLFTTPILLIPIPIIMNRYLGMSILRNVVFFTLLLINVIELL
jgi:hypothetical protein